MIALYMYLFGSFIIALASTVVLFSTTLSMAEKAGLQNSVTENKLVSKLTFFCISMLASPIMFIILTFRPLSEAFITGMYAGMFKD